MNPQEKFNKAKNLHLSGNYLEAQKIYIELIKNNNKWIMPECTNHITTA